MSVLAVDTHKQSDKAKHAADFNDTQEDFVEPLICTCCISNADFIMLGLLPSNILAIEFCSLFYLVHTNARVTVKTGKYSQIVQLQLFQLNYL